MRFALVLALLIAVGAVVFALQNPADVTVRLGPAMVTGSTAIVILVTFTLGAITGMLTAAPGRWRASRRAKQLEKQLHGVAAPTSVETPAEASVSPNPPPPGEVDPYTARFGPPPNQI